MARVARDGTRVPPGDGRSIRPANRQHVMASEGLFHFYHRERRAIETRYPWFIPGFTEGERETYGMLREYARDELREQVRLGVNTLGLSGPYLIPV